MKKWTRALEISAILSNCPTCGLKLMHNCVHMAKVTWNFTTCNTLPQKSTPSENAKLKYSKISILQNCQIKTQLKYSVLQYHKPNHCGTVSLTSQSQEPSNKVKFLRQRVWHQDGNKIKISIKSIWLSQYLLIVILTYKLLISIARYHNSC